MPFLPHYIHQVNPKLKHIYLKFDDEGTLVIRSPKVSALDIELLLLRKSAWIARAQQRLREKKGRIKDFDAHTRIYYLGSDYPVTYHEERRRGISLEFDKETFIFHYDRYDPEAFAKKLDAFYKEEAQRIIPPLVEKWAAAMGVTPAQIAFRKTKRQWGSCSARNRLSFNTMLSKLPMACIEYVVVHELAHIRHKHHQKAFWELVERHLPDYKTQVNTVKTYST